MLNSTEGEEEILDVTAAFLISVLKQEGIYLRLNTEQDEVIAVADNEPREEIIEILELFQADLIEWLKQYSFFDA